MPTHSYVLRLRRCHSLPRVDRSLATRLIQSATRRTPDSIAMALLVRIQILILLVPAQGGVEICGAIWQTLWTHRTRPIRGVGQVIELDGVTSQRLPILE